MNLLIVDDQDVMRQGIRKMVNEMNFDIDEIFEASDGQEALDIERLQKPDIILVDIIMPRMNGIALIDQLKKEGSKAYIGIISAHDDFDIARKAISFKVEEYLLKPISKADLQLFLATVQNKMNEDIRKKLNISEQEHKYEFRLLFDYLTGHDVMENPLKILNAIGVTFRHPFFMIALATIDPATMNDLENSCHRIEKSLNLTGIDSLIFISENRHMVTIGNMEKCSNAFENAIMHQLNLHQHGLQFGMSDCGEGVHSLKKLYEKAQSALKEAIFRGERICKTSCIQKSARHVINLKDCLDLAELLSTSDKEGMDRALESLFFKLKNNNVSLEESNAVMSGLLNQLYHSLEILYPRLDKKITCEERISTANSLLQMRAIMKEILSDMHKHISECNDNHQSSHIVNYLVAKMNKSYAEKVSLREMAAYLGMNYNYVSGLFAKKTGMTYSDYLLRLRLRKAQEFLKEGIMNINEVSTHCGFYDSKYFSKAFKKRFGVTPGEFRNKHANQ